MRVNMRRFATVLSCCSLLVTISSTRPAIGFVADREVEPLVNAQNCFGLELYKSLAQSTTGNVVVSPVSLHSGLHMAYDGSSGETAAELATVLGLENISMDKANEEHRELTNELRKRSLKSVGSLELASSVWADRAIKFRSDYVEMCKRYFDGEVHQLDCSSSGSTDVVNSWVCERTHGRIDNIVSKIAHSSVFLLINAAYFKAPWQTKFDRVETKEEKFQISASADTNVPMMHKLAEFRYMETEKLQAVELPYADGANSMIIVLPCTCSSLAGLRQTISEARWNEWLNAMRFLNGELALPRFTASYETSCTHVLSEAGVKTAFSQRADLSAMISSPPTARISDVIHKGFVKINEEGTEAAAATAIGGMVTTALRPERPPQFKMTVNHPFFFAIMNKSTHALLFVGQITQPDQRS